MKKSYNLSLEIDFAKFWFVNEVVSIGTNHERHEKRNQPDEPVHGISGSKRYHEQRYPCILNSETLILSKSTIVGRKLYEG